MPDQERDSYHLQDDTWDLEMLDLPRMKCGRLDMATYDGETGEPQRFVYFEDDSPRVEVKGEYCDQVAYAANRYQPLITELAAKEEEIERLKERIAQLTRE
ncbi:MAG: hypothetical protein AAGA29_05720 [Planctomycetota bacterium]